MDGDPTMEEDFDSPQIPQKRMLQQQHFNSHGGRAPYGHRAASSSTPVSMYAQEPSVVSSLTSGSYSQQQQQRRTIAMTTRNGASRLIARSSGGGGGGGGGIRSAGEPTAEDDEEPYDVPKMLYQQEPSQDFDRSTIHDVMMRSGRMNNIDTSFGSQSTVLGEGEEFVATQGGKNMNSRNVRGHFHSVVSQDEDDDDENSQIAVMDPIIDKSGNDNNGYRSNDKYRAGASAVSMMFQEEHGSRGTNVRYGDDDDDDVDMVVHPPQTPQNFPLEEQVRVNVYTKDDSAMAAAARAAKSISPTNQQQRNLSRASTTMTDNSEGTGTFSVTHGTHLKDTGGTSPESNTSALRAASPSSNQRMGCGPSGPTPLEAVAASVDDGTAADLFPSLTSTLSNVGEQVFVQNDRACIMTSPQRGATDLSVMEEEDEEFNDEGTEVTEEGPITNADYYRKEYDSEEAPTSGMMQYAAAAVDAMGAGVLAVVASLTDDEGTDDEFDGARHSRRSHRGVGGNNRPSSRAGEASSPNPILQQYASEERSAAAAAAAEQKQRQYQYASQQYPSEELREDETKREFALQHYPSEELLMDAERRSKQAYDAEYYKAVQQRRAATAGTSGGTPPRASASAAARYDPIMEARRKDDSSPMDARLAASQRKLGRKGGVGVGMMAGAAAATAPPRASTIRPLDEDMEVAEAEGRRSSSAMSSAMDRNSVSTPHSVSNASSAGTKSTRLSSHYNIPPPQTYPRPAIGSAVLSDRLSSTSDSKTPDPMATFTPDRHHLLKTITPEPELQRIHEASRNHQYDDEPQHEIREVFTEDDEDGRTHSSDVSSIAMSSKGSSAVNNGSADMNRAIRGSIAAAAAMGMKSSYHPVHASPSPYTMGEGSGRQLGIKSRFRGVDYKMSEDDDDDDEDSEAYDSFPVYGADNASQNMSTTSSRFGVRGSDDERSLSSDPRNEKYAAVGGVAAIGTTAALLYSVDQLTGQPSGPAAAAAAAAGGQPPPPGTAPPAMAMSPRGSPKGSPPRRRSPPGSPGSGRPLPMRKTSVGSPRNGNNRNRLNYADVQPRTMFSVNSRTASMYGPSDEFRKEQNQLQQQQQQQQQRAAVVGGLERPPSGQSFASGLASAMGLMSTSSAYSVHSAKTAQVSNVRSASAGQQQQQQGYYSKGGIVADSEAEKGRGGTPDNSLESTRLTSATRSLASNDRSGKPSEIEFFDDEDQNSMLSKAASTICGRQNRLMNGILLSIMCLLFILIIVVGIGFGTGAFQGSASSSTEEDGVGGAGMPPTSAFTPSMLVTSSPSVAIPTQPPTPAPILGPVASREDSFLNIAPSFMSDPSVLTDASDPHTMAYEWIRDEDPLQMDPNDGSENNLRRIQQRYSLATFWFSSNPSSVVSDSEWLDSSNWLGFDECLWFGVQCEMVNGNRVVTELVFEANRVTGTIPEALAALTHLRVVHIFDNAVSSDGEVGLTGPIPTSIAQWTDLESLRLHRNQLTGRIDSIDMTAMSNLEVFDLSGNLLAGLLPSSMYSAVNLRDVDLSNNELAGFLSTDIEQLSNLESLILNSNGLTGFIPTQLGTLTLLRTLHLGQNDFAAGPIPEYIFQSLTDLESLNLSSMNLNGDLSTRIGNLVGLRELFLNTNELTDEIPRQIGNLVNLEVLHLHQNAFQLQLPDQIGNLEELLDFQVQQNELSGAIPSSITNMVRVERFYIGDNWFTGQLPFNMGDMEKLQDFRALRNKDLTDAAYPGITGPIPSSLGDLTDLRVLSLFQNSLSGEVPPELGNADTLIQLDLEDNALTGTVPLSLAALTDLQALFLGANGIEDPLPSEICGLNELTTYTVDCSLTTCTCCTDCVG